MIPQSCRFWRWTQAEKFILSQLLKALNLSFKRVVQFTRLCKALKVSELTTCKYTPGQELRATVPGWYLWAFLLWWIAVYSSWTEEMIPIICVELD